MNKLTKVGCSALCGSLASIVAANAGDMTVTGGVDMTWMSTENAVTGNPIGIGSNLTFKGSGELDNGWTFDLTVANLNGSSYSAAIVDLKMGGLGSLNFNQGNSGNGVHAYDDKMPTAWEESWGNGLSTGVKLANGAGSSMNIAYTTPKFLGTTIQATYAPEMGAADTADKGNATASNSKDSGYDLTMHINPSMGTEILSGLNIYLGAHYAESTDGNATLGQDTGSGVAAATFDIGPISFGYGVSGHVTGYKDSPGHSNGTTEYYKNHMYGVAFNVNDDLSLSYSYYDTRKEGQSGNASQPENNRYVEVESMQIAYSVGGASLRLAETKGTNVNFAADDNRDMTVLSVGLAF